MSVLSPAHRNFTVDSKETVPEVPTTPATDASKEALCGFVRENTIGDLKPVQTPFGPRNIIYADHTASGRSLQFIEDYLMEQVLPEYANTHTSSSATGRQTTMFRQEAREIVHRYVNGYQRDTVLFVGSGVTGCINKLVYLLGLRRPGVLHGASQEDVREWTTRHSPQAYTFTNTSIRPDTEAIAAHAGGSSADPVAVVFVGPYEHHSNILPWKESIAKVVMIRERSGDGLLDMKHLREELEAHRSVPVKIGSFSAGSNVTGVVTDVHAVTKLLHEFNAFAMWDYACAAPHVKIDMNPAEQEALDAVFFSPHKFAGGPQTPGVLVLKRHIFDLTTPPTEPGGGTVLFVTSPTQRYLENLEEREEGGTPAIVESIRCGMVLQLHEQIGHDFILARETAIAAKVFAAWSAEPNIVLLGPQSAPTPSSPRLPIFSFLIRAGGGSDSQRFLHYNFVCAVLNDVFGIQSRGGCVCAGPYAQKLLGIGLEDARRFEKEVMNGLELVRPGFTRVSLPYHMDEASVQYVIHAVLLVSRLGYALLPQYKFLVETGECKHRTDVKFTQRKWLQSISYASGKFEIVAPKTKPIRPIDPSAPSPISTSVSDWFTSNLEWAERFLRTAAEGGEGSGTPGASHMREAAHLLPGAAESLRWFVLPFDIVTNSPTASSHPVNPSFASDSSPTPLTDTHAVTTSASGPSSSVLSSAVFSPDTADGEDIDLGVGPCGPNGCEVQEPSCSSPMAASTPSISSHTAPPAPSKQQRQYEALKSLLSPDTRPDVVPQLEPASGTQLRSKVVFSEPNSSSSPVTPIPAAVPENPEEAFERVQRKICRLMGQAARHYQLIQEGDRVLVGLSGGKDSLTLLNLLLRMQKRSPVNFEIGVCTVDPMTPAFNPHPLKRYVRDTLKLPYFFESVPIIDSAAESMNPKRISICSFCSRMKRGILYSTCRREGYNVLALGQHLDDLAESFVMSCFYNGRLRTMKAHYLNEDGDIRIIRPFAYVREHMTRRYAQFAKFPVVADNCPGCYTAPQERSHIKTLLAGEEERTPTIFQNLLKAMRPLMEEDLGQVQTVEVRSSRSERVRTRNQHGAKGLTHVTQALHNRPPPKEGVHKTESEDVAAEGKVEEEEIEYDLDALFEQE